MSFRYRNAGRALFEKELDLVDDELRLILVMTNTSADTEFGAQTVSDFGTLDEYDGSGYVSGGVALTNVSIGEDVGADRFELTSDPAVFSSLGVGTRQAQAALLIAWKGTLGASIPLAFYDGAGFPFDGNGLDTTITPNAEGLLQV
jgi:hypothetical protein